MNKTQLSGPQRRIIEQCQVINFGQIACRVRGGQPDLDKPWSTRQTVKLAGGENGPRSELASADFELRKEQTALLDQMARLPDGTRLSVEVKYGLPFLIEIEQDHQAA